MDLREVGCGSYGLDRSGSDYIQTAGSCECGNKPLGSIECGEFLKWLRTYSYIAKKQSPDMHQKLETGKKDNISFSNRGTMPGRACTKSVVYSCNIFLHCNPR
jgi:hypothetical protein